MNKKQDLLPPTDATSEDETNTTLDVVTDLISDTAIPAPIRRNMFKAFDRFCSALIDVPVGALERRSAEKRAESEARIKIGEEVTAQIIQQIKVDPEFPRRASNTFAKRILREQFNLEKIMGFATDIFKEKKYNNSANQEVGNESEKTISDDWFNIFEKEASQKSSEDVQRRFARVLAGEIEKPESYSIRTLNVLGELNQTAAILFERLCSMCMVLDEVGEPFRNIKLPTACTDGRIGWRYSMEIWQLHILIEYGLIVSRQETWLPGNHHIENEEQNCRPFWYQGKYWGLRRLPGWEEKEEMLKIGGISLSQVGREMFHLLKQEQTDSSDEHLLIGHAKALRQFFSDHNLQMAEVRPQKELITITEGGSFYRNYIEWL
ncbi:MAG: DUF2806 domain-containing protein [Candidatus Poribacteria bacterium]|nr:DUF2806 domain-containing protein [Candidatus Poribacteria bacterium]